MTEDARAAEDKILEAALVAYNEVWDAFQGITAHNVGIVRREAMEAALAPLLAVNRDLASRLRSLDEGASDGH